MEPLRTAPESSSFVLLADHQARTPASFHDGPAVLHYHSKQCKLSILETDLAASPLSALRPATAANTANGSTDDEPREVVVDGVDVWVTSEYVTPLPARSSPFPHQQPKLIDKQQ